MNPMLIGVALIAASCVAFTAVKAYNRRKDKDAVTVKTVSPTVYLQKTSEKSVSYTKHTAVAKFEGGEEKEYDFDGITRKKGDIVLYDYVGVKRDPFALGKGMKGRFEKEVTTTISRANLLDFETTDREEQEITTTVSERVSMDPETAIKAMQESPDEYEFVKVESA